MTAFMITKDKIESDAVGVIGPRGASEADVKRLKAGEGVRFRMLDDDQEIYYYGRRLEESDADADYYAEPEFSPLDCFGTPNAGCTEIQYDNGVRDSKGKVVWESL